jgi:hypothetical protein
LVVAEHLKLCHKINMEMFIPLILVALAVALPVSMELMAHLMVVQELRAKDMLAVALTTLVVDMERRVWVVAVLLALLLLQLVEAESLFQLLEQIDQLAVEDQAHTLLEAVAVLLMLLRLEAEVPLLAQVLAELEQLILVAAEALATMVQVVALEDLVLYIFGIIFFDFIIT